MNTDDLRTALEDFVAAAATKDGAAIRGALDRLLAFESQLDEQEVDPRLQHYLQRRSYQKALDYLRGQEPAAGSCGERH